MSKGLNLDRFALRNGNMGPSFMGIQRLVYLALELIYFRKLNSTEQLGTPLCISIVTRVA